MLPGMFPGAAAAALGDITVTDNGDAAPSSGTGSSTHTYNSQTSTGPVSVICLSWIDGALQTLNSVTWNGNAVSLLVNDRTAFGGGILGAAIGIINGAQSGSIVATFSGGVSDSEITKLSLANVVSLTARDTDYESNSSGGADLDSLASPGVGGVRIAVFANAGSSAVTWTNATEASDLDTGLYRHSVAYDLGADATAITADGSPTGEVIAGASIR